MNRNLRLDIRNAFTEFVEKNRFYFYRLRTFEQNKKLSQKTFLKFIFNGLRGKELVLESGHSFTVVRERDLRDIMVTKDGLVFDDALGTQEWVVDIREK